MLGTISNIFGSPSFAWVVVAAAVFALGANVRCLTRRPQCRKKYVKMMNCVMIFYLLVMYTLIALGLITISALAAGMARIAFVMLLIMLSYESILDWSE